MTKLTIKEIQYRILNIAKAFDEICTKNRIPYYMLGGTMLGAVRHKGFIPWDDDMDFGVPAEHYEILLEVLKRELPSQFDVCTFKTHVGCGTAYAKIEDKRTMIDDPRMWRLSLDMQIGLNVDVFPISLCEKSSPSLSQISKMKKRYAQIYTGNVKRSWWKNSIKRILQVTDAHRPEWYLQNIYEISLRGDEDRREDMRGNLLGRWGAREIVPVAWYGENVRYEFEDTNFCGIANYEDYLHSLYGDYMKLPPVEDRISHVDNVYIRDDNQ